MGKKITEREMVFNSMASFLPRKIALAKILTEELKTTDIFKATLLFADISGFTAMSERLARLGKEGAEEALKFNHQVKGR